MAKTAGEFKEELLRNLNGTAADADRQVAFWTRELEYAETPAIAAQTQELIQTYAALAEFASTVAVLLEDVDA
jgi:hypothetical protein